MPSVTESAAPPLAKKVEHQSTLCAERGIYIVIMQALDETAMMEWVSALTEEPNMAALLEPIVAPELVRPRQETVIT